MNVEYKPINDRTPRYVSKSVKVMVHLVLIAAFACLATIAILLAETALYFGRLIGGM
jgi:hypothetical protein